MAVNGQCGQANSFPPGTFFAGAIAVSLEFWDPVELGALYGIFILKTALLSSYQGPTPK